MDDVAVTVPPGPSGHGWAWLLVMCVFVLETIPLHVWYLRRRHLEPIKSRQWQLAIVTTVSLSAYLIITCVCTYVLFEQRDGNLPPTLRPGLVIALVSVVVMPGMVWPIYLRAFVLFYRCALSDAQLQPQLVHQRWLLRNRWVISSPFLFGCYLINLAIHIVLGVVGYLRLSFFFAFIMVQGGLTVGIAAVLATLLWRKREAFNFKTELTTIAFIGVPGLTLWALSITSIIRNIDAATWMVIMCSALVNVMLIYPLGARVPPPPTAAAAALAPHTRTCSAMTYVRARQIRRHDSTSNLALHAAGGDVELTGQAELLGTDGQHKLTKLLADPDILEGFRSYCVESWCTESLQFYFDATQYAALPDNASRLSEARRMWSMYLARDAPLELNVDDAEAAAVKERLDSDGVDASLFEKMRASIVRILYEDTYRRWRTTPAFAAIKARKKKDADQW